MDAIIVLLKNSCRCIASNRKGGDSILSGKEKLLAKLLAKPMPKDFTKQQLDSLMSKCGCTKMSGGRGSSIKFVYRINAHTTRKLIFDEPHPGNNLYSYQIEKVIEFLKSIGQLD